MKIANALAFQVCWWALVLGAQHGLAWPGLTSVIVFAVAQLRLSRTPRADAMLVVIAVVLGGLLDLALIASGLMSFRDPGPVTPLAPWWMSALWAAFALTLTHSLSFLAGRPVLGALLGAAGGPLAYGAAAAGFDVLALGEPVSRTLLVLGVGWAVTVPLLALIAARLVHREREARGA